MDVPTWFLGHVFGGLGEGERIAIFTLPDQETVFFSGHEDAAKYGLKKAKEGKDVYFGVGQYREGIGSGRGKAADVLSLPTLWCDLDYGEGHKKPRPPTEADARWILSQIEVPPSLLVHSGHGLHAYWLLSEPLACAEGAGSLARRWVRTLQSVASAKGWVVDSTFDVTRVLRLPGTLNQKDRPPLPVRMIDQPINPARYHWDELDALTVAEEVSNGQKASTVHVDFVKLDPAASVDSRKLDVLMANDPKFRRTWDHKRSDMKDQSPSAYDLALANIAVMAGWSDQEIANLFIQFRARHNLDCSPGKLHRRKVQLTIANARSSFASQRALTELQQSHPTGAAMVLGTDDPARAEALERLSDVLGVPIASWVQDGQEDADYRLILGDGRDVLVGPVTNVVNQRSFRSRLYEAAAVWPRMVKGEVWDQILGVLARVVDVKENPEGGRVNKLAGWLGSYLSTVASYRGDEILYAVQRGKPFVRDSHLYLNIHDLRRHILHVINERIEIRELSGCLRAGGFTSRVEHAGNGDGQVAKRYWSTEIKGSLPALNLGALVKGM